MTTTTRISDAFVPDRWFEWMSKDTTEKTAIFNSGIMRNSPEVAALLGGGGRTMNMPFWKDLGDSEPGIASDDPAVESTPEKLTSGKDVFRRQVRTYSVSVADLTPVLSGGDPMSRLREASARFWERHFQRTLVHTLTGIFTDNSTNDSSDMINDISTDSAATITSAELISAEAVMDTAQLMGDNKDVFTTLIMHSAIETRLAKQNLIDFIRDSEGNVRVKTYLGYKVVVDDNVRQLTVANGDTTNRTKYWTYLVGNGAVAWGEAALPNAAEVKREPAQGNGMGVETIYMRRQYAMHIPGIKWTDTSVTGEFPSYADLKNVSNWDRVYAERKQIPIGALVTNG